MTGAPRGLVAVRLGVRAWVAEHGDAGGAVAVACSGGPDSLALAAAAVREAGPVTALVVDHGLQPGSAEVARTAATTALGLGCAAARVLPVHVGRAGGPEAAARDARRSALLAARDGAPVLLGHTLDDQAETVLLGLGRGSGARSLAGMRAWDDPWGRPLLGVRRRDTAAACAELGVTPWADPHNTDPAFTRVRLRQEVLPLLEDVLAGGVAAALARTATQLREDDDALAAVAAGVLAAAAVDDELDAVVLARQPAAVRRRVLRAWLVARGARGVGDAQLRACDGLVGRWRGQGAVRLAGGLEVERAGGRVRAVPGRAGAPDRDDPPAPARPALRP